MRVLIVTYHFPPDAEVGGVRPLQVARHLPRFGIEPWVLTVESRFAESPNSDLKPEGVPDERILRTSVNKTAYDLALSLWRWTRRRGSRARGGLAGAPERKGGPFSLGDSVRHWLAFPDERFGWYKPAVRAANDLLTRVQFDAIISTSPPRVASLIAANLSRRHRLPWLMDLRDPWWGWSHDPNFRSRRLGALAFLHEGLFRRLVTRASLVVHNTERLRRHTCQVVPEAEPKSRCIPNGCDSEWHGHRTASPPRTFRIGYYGQIMAWRSPAVFLHGLRLWLHSARPEPSGIAIRFIGNGFEETARQAQALGLSHIVAFAPAVPRQEVPAHMAADYVLLLVANAQPLQVPGKAYEYLAASRRILVLAERDGATADLLGPQTGCVVAETPEEVRAALERFHGEYLNGAEPWLDRTPLLAELQYARRVEAFAEALREIVPRLPGSPPD